MATPAAGAFGNPLFAVGTYAIGRAISPILIPGIKDLENFAWSTRRINPLSADTAAAMWVEGVWDFERANTEASYTGVSESRLRALRELIDNPPDVATLFELWRRGEIGVDRFNEGLRHLRLETDYFEPLRGLRRVILTPAELAAMRQQGYIDAGTQHARAALSGVDADDADLQFEAAGLPPGPETALEMLRRNIIGESEFAQMIREGNTKTKYVDEYLAMLHPLLTVTEIVNLRLRGWINDAEMYQRAALRGYTQAQTRDLFLGQGRPITNRQVFIGQRRGGVYDGPTGAIDPPFLKSLQESNIRPEWYNIAWAQRHSYPSAFVIRQLATSGAIDPTQTQRVLREIGWPEWLIDAVVEAWTGGTTAAPATDPRVKSAVTSAVSEVRSAYILGQADDAAVRGWLDRLGVTVAAELLPIWDVMKEVPQTGLTAAQIKKAYGKTLYTRERAIAELQERGLTTEDAVIYLDE